MNTLRIIFTILAVWRVTRMIVWDSGAFDVFKKIRALFPDTAWYQEGISCPYCVSFWVALPFAYLFMFPSSLGDFCIIWLGLAGAATLVVDLIYSK